MSFAKQDWIASVVSSRLLAITCMTLLVAFANKVNAQGTSGTLPDPISTRELSEYADRLNLSDQQRLALAEMHDQYKAEFKTLRESEIADFLKEMRTMQGVMPKRDQVKDFVGNMKRLQGKIAGIDNRLFDQMQTVLTPEQQSKMPRVRQARQRARYSGSQMMMMSGAPIVDLSGIVHDLNLPPDQLAQIDPSVSQYETKLTSLMGKVYESSGNLFLDMFEALEKAGFTDADVNDPQVQGKIMEAMQSIWQDLMRKALDTAMEIHTLNRRTAKSLCASLASEHARSLRHRFYRQAYPELGGVLGANGQTFAAALKLADLNDEQRQQIEAAQIEFHSKLDRLIEDTADVVDESRRNFSPWAMASEEGNARQKTIADAGKKAGEINAAAMSALSTALNEQQLKLAQSEAMKAMQKEFATARRHVMVESSGDEDLDADDEWEIEEGEDDDVSASVAHAWSGDVFLPAQISQRDVNGYADRLNLDEEQRAVLSELHRAYSDRYDLVKDGEIATLQSLQQSMWKYDETTQTATGPTTEIIDKCYQARTTAMQKIREADEAFFDDMEIALGTPENAAVVGRLRLARERQRYSTSNNTWMWGASGANESGVDIVSLIANQRLHDAAGLEPIIAEYERDSTPLMARRYETSLEMQRAQERWQAEMYAAQRSEGGIATIAQRFQELMGQVSAASAVANANVADLNRTALEKVVALLPAEQANDFRDQYNKQAFPNVYGDPAAIHKKLNAALKVATLTSEQRQKLEDLATEYRPSYANICQRMVEVSAGGEQVNVFSGDPEDAQAWQLREEKLAQLRFERDELNSRATQKLKNILNPEQLAQIGGLPTAAK